MSASTMSLDRYIQQHLQQTIIKSESVGTGLFAAHKLQLESGDKVFIKTQSSPNQQLIHEAKELALLGQYIATPKVLGSDEYCLILQWIDSAHNPQSQAQLGQQLAHLHQQSHRCFGFEFDNKIGQTPQYNAPNEQISNWAEFYWLYRLLPQITLAKEKHHLSQQECQQLYQLEPILPTLLDDVIKPALLHGDLWSGNVISAKDQPYLIDPASYYGHREADFSLSFIFGGFSTEFYQAYQSVYPLDEGFERRKPLYMLYHYLNHLNLFGSGYHGSSMRCAEQLLKTS